MHREHPIKLNCFIQKNLVLAHLAEDNGEFAFILCREGLEMALGKRLKVRDRITIDVDIKLSEIQDME